MKRKEKTEFEKDVKHIKKNLIWWRDWTNRDYLIVGLCLGILLACGFWMLALGLTDENITMQTGDDKVVLIGKAWEGCWLAIGEEDAQLYWKCDRFSAPIGVFVCSEEIAKEQLKIEQHKIESKEKLWWQRDCLDRQVGGVIQEKEECKNCEEWSDLILKEYPSYAYNLPGDVNLQVFKGEIRFGIPSENCNEKENSLSCRIEYESLDGNVFSFSYNIWPLGNSKPMLFYDKYCLEVGE